MSYSYKLLQYVYHCTNTNIFAGFNINISIASAPNTCELFLNQGFTALNRKIFLSFATSFIFAYIKKMALTTTAKVNAS